MNLKRQSLGHHIIGFDTAGSPYLRGMCDFGKGEKMDFNTILKVSLISGISKVRYKGKTNYRATIQRKSSPFEGVTKILLKDVKIEGELLRDHIWVKSTKRLSNFKLGDTIEFNAKVYYYMSPERDSKIGLSYIRNIQKII